MPRSGTGTYSLPAPSPFQNGQTADATGLMTVLSDIATAMTASTANDGQTKITGNWNFNSNNISGVSALTTATLTVSSGAAITGNSTVTGALTVSTAGTTGNQVVNYSQFPATAASPGTMTLPSGIIVKWGTGTTTVGFGSVGFATSFPTAVFNIQITPSGATTVLTIRPLALGAATTSGFQVWGDAAESFGFNWVAIGH
jgi:hypothetical protein